MNKFIVFIFLIVGSVDWAAVPNLSSKSYFSACDKGEKIQIKKTIKKSKIVNQLDSAERNCLMHALETEHVDFALWLIRNSKIDVNVLNKNNVSALWMAVDLELKPVIKELLYKGVNTDIVSKENHQTLLHVAAKIGNTEVVQRILNKNKNKKKNKVIDIKDSNGDTALIKAVIFDHPQLVQQLIKAGADQNLKNNEGLSALDYAKQNQSDELLKILR